jgi:integrase
VPQEFDYLCGMAADPLMQIAKLEHVVRAQMAHIDELRAKYDALVEAVQKESRLVQRLGEAAKMPFPIHPHMLRHACGFKLANQGVDTRSLQHYLGHKNIQHTVRYTELAPDRFKSFWKD